MPTPPPPICPCCGFPDRKAHWNEIAGCLACWYFTGIQTPTLDSYRQTWINGGMQWQSPNPPPAKWNALQHLGAIALKTTRSRVKGRPPRLSPV